MTTVGAHGHMSRGLDLGGLARKKRGHQRSGIREDSKPRHQELRNSETGSPEITELKFRTPEKHRARQNSENFVKLKYLSFLFILIMNVADCS